MEINPLLLEAQKEFHLVYDFINENKVHIPFSSQKTGALCMITTSAIGRRLELLEQTIYSIIAKRKINE